MPQRDPVEPPRLPWDAPREPAPLPLPQPQGPTGSPAGPPGTPPMITVALGIGLVVSLIVNGIVAVNLREREDELATLRSREAQLSEELETLRGSLRTGGGSPLESLQNAVSRIRGLSFKSAVRPEVVTDARLQDRIREQFADDVPRSKIQASDRVLTALGLLDPNEDLHELLLDVNTEVVGGFYNNKTKKLVVAGDALNPGPLEKFLLAHELTHALTDQSFGLSRYDSLSDRNEDDRATAFLAVAEGDASLTSAIYQAEVLTPPEQSALQAELAQAPRAAFDAAPEFLQKSLLFPYQEGLAFVQALHERGGFALVDAAYKDPPLSTEQIMHPARYLARRDDPQTVAMPDVARALGSGWRRSIRGELGEFDVDLILDLGKGRGLSETDASQGAAGWDGGAYAGVDSAKGTLVATLTVWDDEAQAREAAELFGRWLPLRFGNEGSALDLGAGRAWQSGRGAGAVIRSGARLLVLVGPDADSVKRARAAFKGF